MTADCSIEYMTPEDVGVFNNEFSLQYMHCPQCNCPAMYDYWEWVGIDEDKLECPNCHKVVKIGTWHEGTPFERLDNLITRKEKT